jgi:hypothetical protein
MKNLLQDEYEGLYVSVYGKIVHKINDMDKTSIKELGHTGTGLSLIEVDSVGLGLSGCSRMAVSTFYLIVSGQGSEKDCNNEPFGNDLRVWSLKKDLITAKLEPTTGTIEQLLDDKGPLDIRVKPKFWAKLVQSSETEVCLEYGYQIKAEYRVFGGGWNKIFRISDSGKECLGLNACTTIIDAKYIKAQLCVNFSKKEVCLKGKVGYKGISVKIKECVKI